MKKSRIWMSIVPIIAVMITIFCFSAQPADASSKTSGGIVDFVIKTAVPDYQKQSPERRAEIKSKITLIVRKIGHITEFCALGVTVALHLHTVKKEKEKHTAKAKAFFTAFVFCVLYAASDEIHQIFVPGRGPGVADVLIDSVGALLGISAVYFTVGVVRSDRRKINER